MGRAPCCEKNEVKKGPWTSQEDQKLTQYIQRNGHGNWRTLANNAGLRRCGKSCRLRWTNYLRPDIKRGKFTFEEEATIIQLHSFLGNKWSAIAAWLPGRTDNEIKNYWNTSIRKRLLQMGIDPVTNLRLNLLDSSTTLNSYICSNSTSQTKFSNLIGMNQSLFHPEMIRLAYPPLSSHGQQNHDSLIQDQQFNHYYPQMQTSFQDLAIPTTYMDTNFPHNIFGFGSENYMSVANYGYYGSGPTASSDLYFPM